MIITGQYSTHTIHKTVNPKPNANIGAPSHGAAQSEPSPRDTANHSVKVRRKTSKGATTRSTSASMATAASFLPHDGRSMPTAWLVDPVPNGTYVLGSRRPVHPVLVAQRTEESGITARATYLEFLHRKVSETFAARDGSAATHQAWVAAAAEFRTACTKFYEPYEAVLHGVRRGDHAAIDDAVRFLAADPWCFRSGYLKADLMHALANVDVPDRHVPQLQDLVVRRITHREPRLLRYTGQLAANVWTPILEQRLLELAVSRTGPERDAARLVLDRARHRRRSLGLPT